MILRIEIVPEVCFRGMPSFKLSMHVIWQEKFLELQHLSIQVSLISLERLFINSS